jgi:S-methylmethionine-dependent homocysteine/selenocysteine methylase
MTASSIRGRLERGEVILLDGALGTELERRGVPAPLPLWSAAAVVERPDVVRTVHEEYIRAGADVLTTATFRTTPRAFGKAGRAGDAEAALVRAVALAREARDRVAAPRQVLVAGAMAPLEDCYRPDLAPPADVAGAEHAAQAARLARAGVDLILAETMNTIAEARVAVRGAVATGLPVLVSFICAGGRALLSGEDLAAAVREVAAAGADAVLVNCVPPPVAAGCLDAIAAATGLPRGAYANAGAPDLAAGTWSFDAGWPPERFATAALDWVRRGALIVGGCCGTAPAHIRALRSALPPVLIE